MILLVKILFCAKHFFLKPVFVIFIASIAFESTLQARPGDEKPPEVQLPISILRNILLTLKGLLPSGYDQNFRVFKENDYERVYSFESKNCSYDGWLSFDIRRSRGRESLTEVLSWTCNQVRDFLVFKRWGENLEETPSEKLIALNLFSENFPTSFEIEINALNLRLQYQALQPEQFNFLIEKTDGKGLESGLEMLKIKSDGSQNTEWIYRLSQGNPAPSDLVESKEVEEAFMGSRLVKVFETESFYHGDGLYSYQHIIDGRFVARTDFLSFFGEEIKPFLAIEAPKPEDEPATSLSAE